MPFWLRTLLCIVAAEVLGGAGGIITASSIGDWYRQLTPPPGTPPNAVFGPVWTVLYAAMGLSFARVWHHAPAGPAKRRALGLFGGQFLLNLAWTPVFFGWHRMDVALAILAGLLVTLSLTIRAFLRLDRPAGWLLVPYLAWAGYATYLNAGFLLLNR